MTTDTQTRPGLLDQIEQELASLYQEGVKLATAKAPLEKEWHHLQHQTCTSTHKTREEKQEIASRMATVKAELNAIFGQERILIVKREMQERRRQELLDVAAAVRGCIRRLDSQITLNLEPAAKADPKPGILNALARARVELARSERRLAEIQGEV